MSYECPDCGANLDESTSCQSIFDSFLALEFTDPAYGEVHMLTVACFMIQHRRYSHEALAWIEQKLRSHLEGGMPAGRISRQAAGVTSQGPRKWKVDRQPDAPALPEVAWSMTIADVAAGYHDAQSYCELVTRWARVTLREMGPLISES